MQYLTGEDKIVSHSLSAPFIYSLVLPVLLLDLWIELYHRICFPLYGIQLVNRKDYIRIDRHKLPELDRVQKINCVYCGYVNGALSYWARIAGDTEAYWCGVKHQEDERFVQPAHHKNFVPYGDREKLEVTYRKTENAEKRSLVR